jgi:hypothetical protein
MDFLDLFLFYMSIIYQHKRKDTNEVFYVGIGRAINRAHTKKSRNQHWHNIVNKIGYDVEILYEDISWEEACEKEVELIKKYGRMDLKQGPLVNMSDGGDGLHNPSQDTRNKMKTGLGKEPWNKGKIGVYSEEHLERIRETTKKSMQGKNLGESNPMYGKIPWNKGKKHSEETKQKMKDAAKNRNKIT